jgi:two-component system nitrogen regulation sensor histidine kinase NtrY
MLLAALIGAVLLGMLAAGQVAVKTIGGVPLSVPVIFAILTGMAFFLGVLVADRLVDLYRTQRQHLSGARMHGRLAALLSGVALLPIVIAFGLTGTLLGTLTDEFFVDRIETSSSVARNLANAYVESVGQQMYFNAVSAEQELRFALEQGVSPERSPIGYRKFLTGLSLLYQFSELTHIDPSGRIIARTEIGGEGPLPLPPAGQLRPPVVSNEQTPRTTFGSVDPQTINAYFIVIPIDQARGGYLVGYRRELPRIANELVAVRDFRDENRALQARIQELGQVATVGFILMSIVLLLLAAWIGLLVSNAIVGPIRRLATAAERVSSGDLDSRVDIRRRDGELADLGQVFNAMTERLSVQRQDLIEANEDAEARRRFIETMLGVIPAGVISVTGEGEIILANSSAGTLFDQTPEMLQGQNIGALIAPARRLLEDAKASGKGLRKNLEWNQDHRLRSLIVEVSEETGLEEGRSGFVVTLEDITELVTAQRTAAWADVARRIAHEIKNPLTPIQLSAERLKRRFGKDLEGRDREIFNQCTETIVRNVGDIGRMVTEFSSFARMPEPIMSENDLRDIAKEALFPFAVAYPALTFVSQTPSTAVPVLCDNRLVVQAVTNLIKNAAESITESGTENGKIEIEVTRERTGARLEVRDNGRGLPEKLRHRLTEPYMTTREKGTGLGLAIVRKAIEDHDGSFEIRNREGGGAVAALFLPSLQSTGDQGERDPSPMRRPDGVPQLHGH